MPARKWTAVEDLRPHLDPIVEVLQRMPRQSELTERGRADLTNQIVRFGGYRKVAEKLGYPYTAKKSWSHVEDLRPYLDPIVRELGRMPGQLDLKRRRRADLLGAVSKFGGPRRVADLLGYSYSGPQRWTDVEDLRPHLNPIVTELERMPTNAELHARGLSSVGAAIGKFGGFPAVAAVLGYPHTERIAWRTVDDLRPHLDPWVANLKRMPRKRELLQQRRHDLISAIHEFGGVAKVALALGYPYTPRNSFADISDLRTHLDPFVRELGRVPSRKELQAAGRSDLDDAISRFGGRRVVAAELGYRYDGRQQWSSLEDLRVHLDPIVAVLERFPNQADLIARGRADLVGAIH
ncbi:MAG: hypothetical protein M3Q03_18975 [Chloroflexota bacterium]|nr:hypothetical protein [Chloroflexota bacterium]